MRLLTMIRVRRRMQDNDTGHRALIVQLARLGDLMQSLPAITALREHMGTTTALDLLCPTPLAPIASAIPEIDGVVAWDVERWQGWAGRWRTAPDVILTEIEAYLRNIIPAPYRVVFNLNQHCRAILVASLFGRQVIGPGESGPLSRDLPPWADYLRGVVLDRERNRVHLADVFCGLCGVMPPGLVPRLQVSQIAIPADLASIGEGEGPWIGVAVGAGDSARCVPFTVWRAWITAVLQGSATAQVVLIGSGGERELSRVIQDGLSSLHLGRVWDATGRTTIIETAQILSRCQWVVGSDTGPLHLGTAVGSRAMGFYFARARVHETGPYGRGHWAWQAPSSAKTGQGVEVKDQHAWPISDSARLIFEGQRDAHAADGWTLWKSDVDRLGAYYVEAGMAGRPDCTREEVWQRLHQPVGIKALPHEYV
jgi:heptosyltransferase-1